MALSGLVLTEADALNNLNYIILSSHIFT